MANFCGDCGKKLNDNVCFNAFCATGSGGGQDNSCGGEGGDGNSLDTAEGGGRGAGWVSKDGTDRGTEILRANVEDAKEFGRVMTGGGNWNANGPVGGLAWLTAGALKVGFKIAGFAFSHLASGAAALAKAALSKHAQPAIATNAGEDGMAMIKKAIAMCDTVEKRKNLVKAIEAAHAYKEPAANSLGKGNWSHAKLADHANDLSDQAEAASQGANSVTGHEAAAQAHEDAMKAHAVAKKAAAGANSTGAAPDYAAAGFHGNKADFHAAELKRHQEQASLIDDGEDKDTPGKPPPKVVKNHKGCSCGGSCSKCMADNAAKCPECGAQLDSDGGCTCGYQDSKVKQKNPYPPATNSNYSRKCPDCGKKLDSEGDCACGYTESTSDEAVGVGGKAKQPDDPYPDGGAIDKGQGGKNINANRQTTSGEDMAMNREQVIETLTANCDCDRAALNQLDDDGLLTHMATVANAAAQGFSDGQRSFRVNPDSGKWEYRLVANASDDLDPDRELADNSNPEGHDQYSGGGGGSKEATRGEKSKSISVDAASTTKKMYSSDDNIVDKADRAKDAAASGDHAAAANLHGQLASLHAAAAARHDAKGNGAQAARHTEAATAHRRAEGRQKMEDSKTQVSLNQQFDPLVIDDINEGTMTRKEKVNKLIANGLAVEGDRETLLQLSDKALLAFNAKKKKMEDDDEDDEEDSSMEENADDLHSYDGSKGSGKTVQSGGKGTEDEYIKYPALDSDVPAGVKNRRMTAADCEIQQEMRQAYNEQRQAIANQLKGVAKGTDDAGKKRLIINRLKANPGLAELKELWMLVRERLATMNSTAAMRQPVYFGDAPLANVGEDAFQAGEPLALPNLNSLYADENDIETD